MTDKKIRLSERRLLGNAFNIQEYLQMSPEEQAGIREDKYRLNAFSILTPSQVDMFERYEDRHDRIDRIRTEFIEKGRWICALDTGTHAYPQDYFIDIDYCRLSDKYSYFRRERHLSPIGYTALKPQYLALLGCSEKELDEYANAFFKMIVEHTQSEIEGRQKSLDELNARLTPIKEYIQK